MSAGRTALVTNATEFAGPPAVDALVGAGFAVCCHDRSFSDPAARETFAAGKTNVIALETQEPAAIVEEAIEAAGASVPDVVVSNDSYPAILGPVEESDIADLERTLDALVVMPFALMRAVVPHLQSQRAQSAGAARIEGRRRARDRVRGPELGAPARRR